MDTAMRDLERMEERDDRGGQKLGMWIVAAMATAGLVFSMGVLLDRADHKDSDSEKDPLAALDQAASMASATALPQGHGNDTKAADIAPAEPNVETTKLTFPEALSEYDSRPEVEAALAAAAAELEHPDPVGASNYAGDDLPAMPTATVAVHAAPSPMPAGVAASQVTEPKSYAQARDPLLAAATVKRSAPTAPAGYQGQYTLQVASYQDSVEAQAFADSLRARGHQAFVITADIPDRGTYHRVRVGPFESVKTAEDYRAAFENSEHMNTYVVRQKNE